MRDHEDERSSSPSARYASNIAAGLLFGLGVTLVFLAWVDLFGYHQFIGSWWNR